MLITDPNYVPSTVTGVGVATNEDFNFTFPILEDCPNCSSEHTKVYHMGYPCPYVWQHFPRPRCTHCHGSGEEP